MRFRTVGVVMGLLLPLTSVAAQGSSSTGSDMSVGIRVGTLGIGAEVSKLLTDHIGVRVGGNYFSANTTRAESDITYVATAKLQAFTGLVDLYPGSRGSFHFSAGVITNPLTFTGTGQPTNGTITINQVPYTPSQVGTLNATIKWPSASPYLGLGFGTPAAMHGAFKLVFDVGAAIGKPKVSLNATGSAPGLAADLAAQQDSTQNKANKLSVYPVISLGLVYRF